MRTPTARLFAAITAVLLPLALMPSPAQAAETVVVSRYGVGAGSPAVYATTTDCRFPHPWTLGPANLVSRAAGPGTAPRGTGSLELSQTRSQLQSGFSFVDPMPLGQLTALSGYFRFPFPSEVYATLHVAQADTSWLGFAQTEELSANQWHFFNAVNRSYIWIEQGGAVRETGPITIDAFISQYGAGQVTGFVGAGPCDDFQASTVYVDRVRVGRGSAVQLIDYERPIATTVTISTSRSTITSGGSVTLSTTLKSGSKALPYRPVSLWRKVGNELAFSLVTTVKTNENGVARKVAAPSRNTTYQWRYAGGGDYAPDWSAEKLVGVRSKVTLALADSTLRSGQTLVATGRVSPAKVGSVATLWRKTSTGRVKLGSVTMSAEDGSFRITKVLNTRGTYNVYVTVPAASNNLAGTSPTRTATVS